MTDKNDNENNCKSLIFFEIDNKNIFYLDENDEDSDEISLKSTNSFIPIHQEDEENLHRTPSSLNNYSILPPIKSDNHSQQQQHILKHLQEKYQQQNGLIFILRFHIIYLLIFRYTRDWK
jgi:hypothetical protein